MKQCLCLFSKMNTHKKTREMQSQQLNKFLLYTQYKRNLVRQTTGLGKPRSLAVMRKCGLHSYMLITRDNFWTLLSSKSPFLMVSWYCQFLLSGLERTGGDLESCIWVIS